MAVTKFAPAPYAPSSAVLSIIDRHRDRGLPSPVTADVLARSGISESLIPRTLQSLQSLELITEEGAPTELFESLRKAPVGEYPQRLIEWLNHVYADALNFADPATATETQLEDAFREYRPQGQRSRMIALFSGLFHAAGVGPEKPVKSSVRKPVKANGKAKAPAGQSAARSHRSPPPPPPPPPPGGGFTFGDTVPAPLAAMMTRLPADGLGWTKAERDLFLLAFGAVLDVCYPITGSQAPAPGPVEGG